MAPHSGQRWDLALHRPTREAVRGTTCEGVRGQWSESIAEIQQSGRQIPLLDWHGNSLDRIIGRVVELKDLPAGLWFRALFTSDEKGQRARQLVQEGHLSGVSVGYSPLNGAIRMIGGQLVRVLIKARLHEISLTPIPANPMAQIEGSKAEDRYAANWQQEIDLERERFERRNDYDAAMKAVMGSSKAGGGCGACLACRRGLACIY